MNDIVNFIGSNGHLMVMFLILLFSLCFHEFAHGWVARRKGDRTAEMMGRLTLNPVAHIDWIGTVTLPLVALFTGLPFIGWAKPVPVNERNLSRPKQDMFWIAFAGPLSNVLLGLVGTVALTLIIIFGAKLEMAKSLVQLAHLFIMTNLFLAIFNLLPMHPLDGGKVLARFLPHDMNLKLEGLQQYTSIILIIALLSGALRYLAIPVQWMTENLVSIAFSLGALLNS